MKTEHKDLNEYMLWLAKDCEKHFDNDQDLIDCNIKVSEDILLRNNVYNYSLKNLKKDEVKKALIGMINATIQLMQVAPALIFQLHADMCAFCWIRDNLDDNMVKCI